MLFRSSSSVDGQDVLATYAHFRDLAEEVRSGGGPRFVDLKTYRFRGHTQEEADAVMARFELYYRRGGG